LIYAEGRYTGTICRANTMKEMQSREPDTASVEDQERDLAAALGSAPAAVPLRPADLHTRTMFVRVREQITKWEPQGPSAASVPKTYGPLEKMDVIPGILAVPTLDEDGDKVSFVRKLAFRALRALPLVDDPNPWASPETAEAVITKEFVPILPVVLVRWTDVTSDRSTSLLAFGGLAAHRLVPLDDDPEGAAYAVDLTWMQAFAVRPGLEPYGASAYFGADRSLQRVYTAHDDATHRPGDASWEDAKWRWRSALFAAVTVADHLGATHYLASNLLVTVTRERLPENHPLRRFLKPFGYGAVDINLDAALILSPEGGLAERLFSFTYTGMSRCLLRGIETTTFRTFPKVIAEKRVESLGDGYPYATDGLALYDILQTYVEEYLDIFFPGDAAIHDPAIRAWWQGAVAFAPTLNLGPLNRRRQLVDLLAQLLFTVTGFQAQVGAVVQYLLDPAFITAKIRAGTQMSDVQATVQVLNLTALTGLEQPPLIGDYTHIFLEEHKDRTLAAFERYQRALLRLSAEIERRNEHRDQPFETFNPAFLDVSVST
jgi:hypothetical protein